MHPICDSRARERACRARGATSAMLTSPSLIVAAMGLPHPSFMLRTRRPWVGGRLARVYVGACILMVCPLDNSDCPDPRGYVDTYAGLFVIGSFFHVDVVDVGRPSRHVDEGETAVVVCVDRVV